MIVLLKKVAELQRKKLQSCRVAKLQGKGIIQTIGVVIKKGGNCSAP